MKSSRRQLYVLLLFAAALRYVCVCTCVMYIPGSSHYINDNISEQTPTRSVSCLHVQSFSSSSSISRCGTRPYTPSASKDITVSTFILNVTHTCIHAVLFQVQPSFRDQLGNLEHCQSATSSQPGPLHLHPHYCLIMEETTSPCTI